jgi:hypothetical protein
MMVSVFSVMERNYIHHAKVHLPINDNLPKLIRMLPLFVTALEITEKL